MAELVTVARPYAKAAFNYALESNALDAWSDMLAFAAAVMLDSDMSSVLDNPQLTAEQQADTFINVCGDKLNEGGKNFVTQLAQNKRLAVLPEISVLFESFLAEQQKRCSISLSKRHKLRRERAPIARCCPRQRATGHVSTREKRRGFYETPCRSSRCL